MPYLYRAVLSYFGEMANVILHAPRNSPGNAVEAAAVAGQSVARKLFSIVARTADEAVSFQVR